MKIYLFIAAITLGACAHHAESPATIAEATPHPVATASALPSASTVPMASASAQAQQETPDADWMPPFERPPGTLLVAVNANEAAVDAAPGKPASSALPAGSVYIGFVADRSSGKNFKYVPTIVEWDVARDRVLRSVDVPLRIPEGYTETVRIATFRDTVYVALNTSGVTGVAQLFVLDAFLRPRKTHSFGVVGEDISLEANEKYLAVAYKPDGDTLRPLKVELFDANNLTPIATTSIGAADWVGEKYLVHDALEFFGDRLYVAGVPPFTEPPPTHPSNNTPIHHLPFTHVFAMDLPSLKIARTYKSTRGSYYQTTLQSAAGHLFLTGFKGAGTENWEDKYGYDELTADLKPIRSRQVMSYADAFDPNTGRAFSCHDKLPQSCCGDQPILCHAFWTGLEPAFVGSVWGRIVFARLKDWSRGKGHKAR